MAEKVVLDTPKRWKAVAEGKTSLEELQRVFKG